MGGDIAYIHWQLTGCGTLAHDKGEKESSHDVSSDDRGSGRRWGGMGGAGQSFSSGQLTAAL